MPSDDTVELDVAGRTVAISHPGRVFFSQRGDTKLDLVHYYLAVGEPLLEAMGGRPVLLQRFPDGASGKSFFQKRVPAGAPDWLTTTIVSTPNGTTANALVAADLAHVIWAVNQACLGFHVWPSFADDQAHVDELRLDLDPQPGVTFPMVREAAHEVRRLLADLGLRGYPKTTGNRGLHVYLRLTPDWDAIAVRSAAVAVARELERRRPDLITAAWWKEERGERVFIDFNQNAPHKTVFGAWSVRARVGAQVSTPFALGRPRQRRTRRAHASPRCRPGWRSRATPGPRSTSPGSRWSRCSPSTSATAPPACSTRPGRRCTRRCPASRLGWLPAGPASPTDRSPLC